MVFIVYITALNFKMPYQLMPQPSEDSHRNYDHSKYQKVAQNMIEQPMSMIISIFVSMPMTASMTMPAK